MEMNSNLIIFVIWCALALMMVDGAIIQTVSGSVGAGNFSYFKVTLPDAVVIELIPVTGDPDLYVSDVSTQPSWDDYEALSATCGIDTVVIPRVVKQPLSGKSQSYSFSGSSGGEHGQVQGYDSDVYHDDLLDSVGLSPVEQLCKQYKRPVYIGIYGHPGFEVSRYELHLYLLDDDDMVAYDESSQGHVDGESEWGSLLLEFLATILKILLETII